jgi:hypothetical protein
MRNYIATAIVGMALLSAITQIAEARDIRTEHVRFPPGSSGTTIKDRIVGYQSVSYIVGAEAGQTMTIVLKPSNGATYFNVYPPGKGPGDDALANSSMTPDLNRFKGQLSVSGNYTISVYMMRSAARRKERSNYTLDIAILAQSGNVVSPVVTNDYADGLQGGPDFWKVKGIGAGDQLDLRDTPSASGRILTRLSDGAVLRNKGCRMAEGQRWCAVELADNPAVSGWVSGMYLSESAYAGAERQDTMVRGSEFHASQDALVPGTKFHATGEIPCARGAGQPFTNCNFGVVRKGDRSGYIRIFWPDGGNRVIYFENGAPKDYDKSEADRGERMSVSRNSDLFTISIGDQRFEVFEAVITGG